MKRIIALMLTVMTASFSLFTSAFAEETRMEENVVELEEAEQLEETEQSEETENVEPRASLYFSSYTYDLEPSSKNGYLDFSSLVVITNRTDKVRVSVQIQQYNDGWEDYGGEYIGTSSKAAYSFSDTVKVDRGEEYRAKFYYEAIVNGKVVETKTFATSGVVAP